MRNGTIFGTAVMALFSSACTAQTASTAPPSGPIAATAPAVGPETAPADATGKRPLDARGVPLNAPDAPNPYNVEKGPPPGDPYAQYYPDKTHTPFFRPDQIPWTGEYGVEQQYFIYGDAKKPGPYAMLLKWFPGHYSDPHYHPNARDAVVISGTWWASSSNVKDPSKTYPLGPGTVVTDVIGTVHWDGAKAETGPVVLLLTGDGPSPNVNVGPDGKPLGKVNF